MVIFLGASAVLLVGIGVQHPFHQIFYIPSFTVFSSVSYYKGYLLFKCSSN